MTAITIYTSLNESVRKIDHADEYSYMIRMSDGIEGRIAGLLTLNKLSKLSHGVWNADSMANGLMFVQEHAKEHTIFYPLWSKSDCQKDSGKKNTGILSFLHNDKRKFALICAGGGYGAVASVQEAFPVASKMYAKGYSVFVLQYRTGKHAIAPNPMDDLAHALKFIFNNAEQMNVDITNYALIGFSAGGHLVASFGTETIGYAKYELPRPGILMLAYPVITMGEYTDQGTLRELLGKNSENDEKIEMYSIEKHITPTYPKTFIWQCDRDQTVPFKNSELLVSELRRNHIDHQYETFPSDAHGWGLGEGTYAQGWLDRAIDFWKK